MKTSLVKSLLLARQFAGGKKSTMSVIFTEDRIIVAYDNKTLSIQSDDIGTAGVLGMDVLSAVTSKSDVSFGDKCITIDGVTSQLDKQESVFAEVGDGEYSFYDTCLDKAQLDKLIKLSAFAGDDDRPVLKCFNVMSNGLYLTVVATDGYHLGRIELFTNTQADPCDIAVNVPVLLFTTIAKVANECSFSVSKSAAWCTANGVTVSVKLDEGLYPNYKYIISDALAHSVATGEYEAADLSRVVTGLCKRQSAKDGSFWQMNDGRLTISLKDCEATLKTVTPTDGKSVIMLNPKLAEHVTGLIDTTGLVTIEMGQVNEYTSYDYKCWQADEVMMFVQGTTICALMPLRRNLTLNEDGSWSVD